MAIGSEGEIGQRFGKWGDMTLKEREAWWEHMRTKWHETILAGYAKIDYPRREE